MPVTESNTSPTCGCHDCERSSQIRADRWWNSYCQTRTRVRVGGGGV